MSLCIEARVPYNFEVRVGVLPFGDYKVLTNANGSVTESLSVAEATSAGPDEYLYAPVDNVAVERLPHSHRMVGVLSGRFTNSCMQWDEVKVIDTDKTIQVLPIIEMDSRTDCVDGVFPFKKSFLLPETMANGRHLLHVRSLNGRDVNQMFTVVPN